jgi:branched-chain amino acid transport system substrate-binding protein
MISNLPSRVALRVELLFWLSLQAAAAGNANITIGLLLPPEEAQAASIRDGVTMAVDDANRSAKGQVRLVIRGRIGQWGADAVEAARLVTDDAATGLLAPTGGAASHLALQVAGRTAVPVISLCADSSITRTGVPWMLRVVPRTIEEARALFAGASARAGSDAVHWTAVVPEGPAGREIARDLKTAAAAAGCKVEFAGPVPSPLTNAEAICKQVLASRADAVLLWLDPSPAGILVKALRAAGFKATLAGPCRLRSKDFIVASGDALEGVVVPGLLLGKASQELFARFDAGFRERFGYEPDALAAMSYDAASVLVHLLRQTDTAASLSHAFPVHFSLPGASGNLSFDADGNRQAALQLFSAHGGVFAPVRFGVDQP